MCISEKMCILCVGIIVGVLAIGIILTNFFKSRESIQDSGPLVKLNFPIG